MESALSKLPEAISYADLCKHNAKYRPDLIQKHNDLYSGDEGFYEHIDNYLVKRQIEEGGLNGSKPHVLLDRQVPVSSVSPSVGMGQTLYEARKKVAYYTPFAAGLIDFLSSAVFYSTPAIEGADPYYESLNQDADGTGKSLRVLLQEVLLDLMLHGRPCITISTVNPGPFKNLAEQRASGGLDCRLGVLLSKDITDWVEVDGKLQWVRTYREEPVRSQPHLQPDSTRKLWTYIDEQCVQEYEIVYKNSEPPKPETLVARKDRKEHAFGALPVIPIKVNTGFWVMQRLAGPILALYNRKASLSFSLYQTAYPWLLLKVVNPAKLANMVISELGAVVLDPSQNEGAEYISPPSDRFTPLENDVQTCKADLAEVLQMMAANAMAVQTQNARQSAAAKSSDKESFSALLKLFADELRSDVTNALALIAKFRGDATPATITGMEEFDLLSVKQKLDNLTECAAISGYPKSALKAQIQNVALAASVNSSPAVRRAIVAEIKASDLDEIEPAPIAPVVPLSKFNSEGIQQSNAAE